MATWLKTDGSQHPITEPLTLETMQKLVGGCIEMLNLGGNEFLIVNETGLLDGLPINITATQLYRSTRDPAGVIVGDAIRCVVANIGLETETYS